MCHQHYLRLDAASAAEQGQLLQTPVGQINFPFESELTWFEFSTDLGTWFRDTMFFGGTIEGFQVGMTDDSVRFERTIYRIDTVAASANLLMSSGYFSGVLRKTTHDYSIDTTYT